MLLTYQSPPHKFGAFTWLESSQSENVTFLANAMLCEHKYIAQTGNNDELEYKVCVKAQVKNGPAVDANTHL